MAPCAIPVAQTAELAGNLKSLVWKHQTHARKMVWIREENRRDDGRRMWSIGDGLRQRRREIEELCDYRYSQLTPVFGRLILEGYLDEKQLTGLADDKLREIRHFISFAQSQ